MTRSPKTTRLVAFCAIVTVCAMVVAAKWNRATDPHLSLGEWESASVWWQRGKCSDCHREEQDGETSEFHVAGAEPTSHKNPCWLQVHGRATASSEARCFVCHSTAGCQSCHNHAPATHTAGFLHPSSGSQDANRHVLLVRLRPSSCLVCHGNFVSTCGQCHAPGELHECQQQALADLQHWPTLMDSRRNQTAAQANAD